MANEYMVCIVLQTYAGPWAYRENGAPQAWRSKSKLKLLKRGVEKRAERESRFNTKDKHQTYEPLKVQTMEKLT